MGKDENIKSEIVTQAARLFRKWGYNKTTIEDIAKASGKGKSSLYYYFGDKEEIFLEVIKREADEMNALVKQELLKCSGAAEELKHILAPIYASSPVRQCLQHSLRRDGRKHGPAEAPGREA
jgi:AcrR family transcriptional regulator